MPKFKKILCPYDLQSTSFDALRVGSQLARRYGAELVVLHIVPSALPMFETMPLVGSLVYPASGYEDEMKRNAQKNLNHALRDALAPDVTARAIVTMGCVAPEISRVAGCEGCDLIVMEPHGAVGLGAQLFGTTCEHVLRQSAVPVWLVRAAVQARHAVDDPNAGNVTGHEPKLGSLEIRKILCPTDGSAPARAALQLAREMALEMHAELCVLHVYEPSEPVMGLVSDSVYDADLKREASELIARETAGWGEAGVSLRPLVRAGAPATEILAAIDEEHPDLTIIATRGNSGWKRLVLGSVAEPVARLASCPVLTVHQPSEQADTENVGVDARESVSYVSGPTVATSDVAAVEAAKVEEKSVWQINADDYPATGTREEKLKFLLGYAILAPSNRNTQPWLWRLTDEGLELYADTSRSLPLVDPNDRELFIACGAALFNLRVALRYFGYEFETHILPDEGAPDLLARLPIREPATPSYHSGSLGTEAIENAELFAEITRRHTYRGAFEPDDLDASFHIQLKEAAREEGTLLRFVEADERERVVELVGRAAISQAGDPELRHEWDKWIRADEGAARHDGLARASVGLAPDEKADSYISHQARAARDEEKVALAPTLILLETERDLPADWLATGAALQRVTLRARSHDIFASYFNQVIEVTEVWRSLRNQLGLLCHPQLLFRLGHPVEPERVVASPRRSVEEVVVTDLKTSRALGHYVSSRAHEGRKRE